MENKTKADIVVLGAGLVGLSAAIAMAQQGKQVTLVNALKLTVDRKNAWDTRVYTITPAVESWLQSLDVWPLLKAERVADVDAMQLWPDTDQPPLMLESDDANLPKLACVVENKNLLAALWKRIKSLDISVLEGEVCEHINYLDDQVVLTLASGVTLNANLLLAADGSNSFVRQALRIATHTKDFAQTAVVANFVTEKAHGNIARQWFAKHDTLALLPLPNNDVSMVWSVSTEKAEKLLNISKHALQQAVEQASGSALGKLGCDSDVLGFELKQVTASQFIANRVVLLGDAAHQIHPMAGQGMNLGFRDVIALQSLMAKTHALDDIGDRTFLRQYERSRKADVIRMNGLTSGLDYWFANDHVVSKKLTDWAMQKLMSHGVVKKALINQAVA